MRIHGGYTLPNGQWTTNRADRRPAPLPEQPTPAAAGTPEKLLAMQERALRREQLCHPLDGRRPDLS
jgi:hypothetical protein